MKALQLPLVSRRQTGARIFGFSDGSEDSWAPGEVFAFLANYARDAGPPLIEAVPVAGGVGVRIRNGQTEELFLVAAARRPSPLRASRATPECSLSDAKQVESWAPRCWTAAN